jgi:hypothetical protein
VPTPWVRRLNSGRTLLSKRAGRSRTLGCRTVTVPLIIEKPLGCRRRCGFRVMDRSATLCPGVRAKLGRGRWSLPPPEVTAAGPESSRVPTVPECHTTRRLTRWLRSGSAHAWWRIRSPRLQPRRWLSAQPKGYAACILFPHLNTVPRLSSTRTLISSTSRPFRAQ